MKVKIQTNKKIAQELAAYMQQRGMEPEVQMEGQEYTLVVSIDKEENLSCIKSKYKLLKAAHAVESGADKVVGATDETLRFITNQVVVPVVKTGARTAGSLVKATARTITATGFTLVTEVIKSAKDTAEEIKQDKNVQVIKKELSKTKGFFAGLRGRKKKKDADFIIEE